MRWVLWSFLWVGRVPSSPLFPFPCVCSATLWSLGSSRCAIAFRTLRNCHSGPIAATNSLVPRRAGSKTHRNRGYPFTSRPLRSQGNPYQKAQDLNPSCLWSIAGKSWAVAAGVGAEREAAGTFWGWTCARQSVQTACCEGLGRSTLFGAVVVRWWTWTCQFRGSFAWRAAAETPL